MNTYEDIDLTDKGSSKVAMIIIIIAKDIYDVRQEVLSAKKELATDPSNRNLSDKLQEKEGRLAYLNELKESITSKSPNKDRIVKYLRHHPNIPNFFA